MPMTTYSTRFLIASSTVSSVDYGLLITVFRLFSPRREPWDATGAFFSEEQLRATVSRHAALVPEEFFDRVVSDKMLICGAHFPWPGVGHIAREGAGYAFTLS